MTPAARIAAAIEVLDEILDGKPAEPALIAWSRGSRFAGSKDRAAVRDHVFDALRCKRSFAALGGAETGRGLMIGALRAGHIDPASLFTGEGHAPAALTPDEQAVVAVDLPAAVALDWPEWLMPQTQADLGNDLTDALSAMQGRGPLFLRVNTRRGTLASAQNSLNAEGIGTEPHPQVAGCLIVTDNPRRVQNCAALQDGLIEIQDAASQMAVARLPMANSVLDYCAGGGGKSLALADRGMRVIAHDKETRRMQDIPSRAARAGVRIDVSKNPKTSAPYGMILCDAPCSGSGTWRRTPDAKWRLSPERLAELTAIQSDILEQVHPMVAADGTLAYATCSILRSENRSVVDRFLSAHPDWVLTDEMRLLPCDLWDGFYLAQLKRR